MREDPLNNINTGGIDNVIKKSISKLRESLRSSWIDYDKPYDGVNSAVTKKLLTFDLKNDKS
jgi:hypothetical protein